MLETQKLTFLKNFINSLFYAVIFFIVFFGIYFRTFGILHPMSFFCDEGGLIHNLQVKNYLQLFMPLEQFQCCPPFFMILSKLIYVKYGVNEVYLRLLPFFSSTLSLFLFLFLISNLFKNKLVLIFALLTFTFNIKLITYSYIFKHYTTDLLISILLLIFALCIRNRIPDTKKSMLAAIFCILCIFSSYTSCIIIVAIFTAYFGNLLLNKSSKDKRIQILKSLFTFGICFFSVVAVYYVLNCVPNISNYLLQTFWHGRIPNAFFFPHNFLEFQKIIMFLSGMPVFCFPVIIILIGLSIVKLFKENKYLLIILTLPFIIGLVLGILSKYPFAPERVSIYLIPLFIILISYSLEGKFKRQEKIIKTFICLFLVFINVKTALNFNGTNLVEEYSYSNMRQFFEILEKSDITQDDFIFPNYYNKDLFITYDTKHIYKKSQLIAKYDEGDLKDFFPDDSNIYFFLSDKYVMYSKAIEKVVRDNCKIIYEAENYYGNFIKCYYKKK